MVDGRGCGEFVNGGGPHGAGFGRGIMEAGPLTDSSYEQGHGWQEKEGIDPGVGDFVMGSVFW